jgi:phage N-6-adenine-methyltransferase
MIQQLSLFDYDSLDTETRIVVRQKTEEIHTLMRRTARDIFDIGQKLLVVKNQLGHGNFGQWLKAEFNWSDRTAQRYMSVATQFECDNLTDLSIAPSALYLLASSSTPQEARNEALELAQKGVTITSDVAKQIIEDPEPIQEVEELPIVDAITEKVKVEISPKTYEKDDAKDGDEWYTPKYIVGFVRLVLGGIDVDLASCEVANKIVQAKVFYTKQDDGLKQPLKGKVFCNPPYSNPAPFVEAILKAYRNKEIESAIILLNSNTDTQWFYRAFVEASSTCFTSGRISFWRSDRKGEAARQGQVIFYFGDNPDFFKQVFKGVGIFAICANEIKQNQPPLEKIEAAEKPDIETLSWTELKKLAAQKNIPNLNKLNRTQILKKLGACL